MWKKICKLFIICLTGIFTWLGSTSPTDFTSNVSQWLNIIVINYLPSWLNGWVILIVGSIISFLPLRKLILNITKDSLLISLKEAVRRTYERIRYADYLDWSSAGVTRKDYTHHQVMFFIKDRKLTLYGYITCDGVVSNKSSIEAIPYDKIPDFSNGYTKWDDNYNILISKTGELLYINVSVKQFELEEICNYYKNMINEN